MVRRERDRAGWTRLAELEQLARSAGRDEERVREKRRQIRHNCAVKIIVLVRHSSGTLDVWHEDKMAVSGRVLDLSTKGASVFCGQHFEAGQQLGLNITLDGDIPVAAQCAVRWVKGVPDKRGFAHGVEFTGVSDKDKQKIDRFLNELDRTLGF